MEVPIRKLDFARHLESWLERNEAADWIMGGTKPSVLDAPLALALCITLDNDGGKYPYTKEQLDNPRVDLLYELPATCRWFERSLGLLREYHQQKQSKDISEKITNGKFILASLRKLSKSRPRCRCKIAWEYEDDEYIESNFSQCDDTHHNFEHIWWIFYLHYPDLLWKIRVCPEFPMYEIVWQTELILNYPWPNRVMDEKGLFRRLVGMLSITQDGHVEIESREYGLFCALPDPASAFCSLKSRHDLNHIQMWTRRCFKMQNRASSWMTFVESLLHERQWLSCSTKMITPADFWHGGQPLMNWGWLHGKVGETAYLLISSFECDDWDSEVETNIDSSELELEREAACRSTTLDKAVEEELDKEIKRFLASIYGAKRIVVDLCYNEGGWDSLAIYVAQQLFGARTGYIKKCSSMYSPIVRRYTPKCVLDSRGTWQFFNVEPKNNRFFKGNVILLVNNSTASAAEVFATIMLGSGDKAKARATPVFVSPGVESAVFSTAGILSDCLEPLLPNGWRVSLTHEMYYECTGSRHLLEARGIRPEIVLKTKKDIVEFISRSF
eukprot:UC4_evm4s1044